MQHIFTSLDGRIGIAGISLSLSLETILETLTERGFVVVDKGAPAVLQGNIDGLGICSLKIFKERSSDAEFVGLVIITTEREFDEAEMTVVLGQMKEDLHAEPLYDDGGYGVLPKPHEIRHFWDLELGYVTINWHGDDRDHITIWLRKPLVKDEAYWRSEVD